MRLLLGNFTFLAEDVQKGRLVRYPRDSGLQASRQHSYNDFLGYKNLFQLDS